MVKQVTKFETSDGKLFDNEFYAIGHQKIVDFTKKIKNVVMQEKHTMSLTDGEVDLIVEFIKKRPNAIASVLNSYFEGTNNNV